MVGLVCIDVDGTLVGSTGAPTDVVWAAAERARRAGVHLAICTARIAIGPTWEWACRLDPDGWHLFQTGASLVHAGDREFRSHPIPEAQVERLMAVGERHDWVVEYYADTDYVVDDERPLAVDHADLLGLPFRRRHRTELDGPVVRVQFVVPEQEEGRVRAAVPEGLESSSATSPAMPGAAFVSVTHAGVTKAAAIARLAGVLDLSIEQVMMVGDGHNDAEAIAAVGHGVAMGNAHPAARAAARHHVGHVDADGLAEALDLAVSLR